jgi:hypothetical protein
MALLVLQGNYTPQAWAGIRENPEQAPREIAACLDAVGGKIEQFFFSLDQFDFYCFAHLASACDLGPLRHLLFIRGQFATLEAEPLLAPGELLPRLRELCQSTREAGITQD